MLKYFSLVDIISYIDLVLTLSIIDRNTKELLEEYLIPIGHFSPIRPYHLELVQVSNNSCNVYSILSYEI